MRVIVLPGLDGTGRLLTAFSNALGRSFETQVLDYPQDKPLGYEQLTEYVRQQLSVGERYVLVAESFSGPIAVCLAASNPPGLAGLVFCSSFIRAPFPWLSGLARLARWLPMHGLPVRAVSALTMGRWTSATWEAAIQSVIGSVSVEVLRSRVEALLRVDSSESAQRVAVPTLYLRATNDRLVPRSAGELVARTIRQTQVVELDGPHFLLQAQPAVAAKEIIAFIERCEAGRLKGLPRNPACPSDVR